MNEKNWNMFFDLVERIIGLPYETWREKADRLLAEAKARGMVYELEEIAAWIFEE